MQHDVEKLCKSTRIVRQDRISVSNSQEDGMNSKYMNLKGIYEGRSRSQVGRKAQRHYASSPMENITSLQIPEEGICQGWQCTAQTSVCHMCILDSNSPIDTKDKCQVDVVQIGDVKFLSRV